MPKLRSDELGLFSGSQLSVSTTNGGSRARTVATGALHLLKLNWAPGPDQAQLRSALILACFLSFGLGLLLLLPAAMALANHRQRQFCHPLARTSLGRDSGESTNVYFLKHENRSWTTEELCHIETAARRYPEFNIHIINLRSNANRDGKHNWNSKLSNLPEKSNLFEDGDVTESSNKYDSRILSNRLMEIPNVVNFDVELDRFFAGSAFARKIEDLGSRDIETAARFQAIWDSPGISLDPSAIRQLDDMGNFDERRERKVMARVQIESDFQATSVPCHSFVGQMINEIARDTFTDRKTALKHALKDFCPSLSACAGVKVMEPSLTEPQSLNSCPIVELVSADIKDEAIRTNSLIPEETL